VLTVVCLQMCVLLKEWRQPKILGSRRPSLTQSRRRCVCVNCGIFADVCTAESMVTKEAPSSGRPSLAQSRRQSILDSSILLRYNMHIGIEMH
jgi:hypothetical protein